MFSLFVLQASFLNKKLNVGGKRVNLSIWVSDVVSLLLKVLIVLSLLKSFIFHFQSPCAEQNNFYPDQYHIC